jgi:sulfatase modifying factor 1
VTNVQYKKFIDANKDYDVPADWNSKNRTYPTGRATHPVVEVTWNDAKAYADWAGVALPTEQQWEKAARGTDGREYPWGDSWQENHCNAIESGIADRTPVGQFSPQGDSPYGCVDMSGNVWEWTDGWYDEDKRVGRGGSWGSDANRVCAACRCPDLPTYRSGYCGFRVVVRRPPSQ